MGSDFIFLLKNALSGFGGTPYFFFRDIPLPLHAGFFWDPGHFQGWISGTWYIFSKLLPVYITPGRYLFSLPLLLNGGCKMLGRNNPPNSVGGANLIGPTLPGPGCHTIWAPFLGIFIDL